MQDSIPKKPKNTQISEDNSDNFDVPADVPIEQEQKEIGNNSLKESQKIPEKTSITANEQNISDNVLPLSDILDNALAENNEKKVEIETSAQKPLEETKEIADEKNQEPEELVQKDLLNENEPLEKLDLEEEKIEPEVIENPQKKNKRQCNKPARDN